MEQVRSPQVSSRGNRRSGNPVGAGLRGRAALEESVARSISFRSMELEHARRGPYSRGTDGQVRITLGLAQGEPNRGRFIAGFSLKLVSSPLLHLAVQQGCKTHQERVRRKTNPETANIQRKSMGCLGGGTRRREPFQYTLRQAPASLATDEYGCPRCAWLQGVVIPDVLQ